MLACTVIINYEVLKLLFHCIRRNTSSVLCILIFWGVLKNCEKNLSFSPCLSVRLSVTAHPCCPRYTEHGIWYAIELSFRKLPEMRIASLFLALRSLNCVRDVPVRVSGYICVSVHVHVRMCDSVSLGVRISVRKHVCASVGVSVHLCLCVCVHECSCVSGRVSVRGCICVSMCVLVRARVSAYAW
jgi:hypothetical protein